MSNITLQFLGLVALAVALWVLTKLLRAASRRSVGNIRRGGTFETEVVGESHYQAALARICGGITEDGAHHRCQAVLIPEPDNPNDRNAVRVEIDGATVGYLNRQQAKAYQKELRRQRLSGRTLTVEAVIQGGWDRGGGDRGMFGVRLDMPAD